MLKWPTFESDSQSVIFQSTVPGDSCCRNDGRTAYGYMAPTNYYEDPGRLWSVDANAVVTTPVLLSTLNAGEQLTDANKSYQPSMLPVAAGGYRWVVFTSTRPYGNTLNPASVQQDFSDPTTYATASYTAMTNTNDIQSQLWVSAIDDATSNTTDRSHPAFWLPSQNFAPSSGSATGYLNERAVWVLDACRPTGKANTSTCEVDEDCCGGVGPTKTAACHIDTPLSNPLTRHCQPLPAGGGLRAGERWLRFDGGMLSGTRVCRGDLSNATAAPAHRSGELRADLIRRIVRTRPSRFGISSIGRRPPPRPIRSWNFYAETAAHSRELPGPCPRLP